MIENIIYQVPSKLTYTKRYKNAITNRMNPNKNESSVFFVSFSISPTLNFGLMIIGRAHTRKKNTVRNKSNFGIAIMEICGKKIKKLSPERDNRYMFENRKNAF